MTINTYINTSDDRTLNKTLTVVESLVNCVLKDDTEMIRPTIILSKSTDQSFNYVYIPTFDRYYFVRSKTYSQQRYYIECEVDVLQSFSSDIESLKVIANRSSSTFNAYQHDSEISKLAYNTVTTRPFSSGFNGLSIVIAVAGD